MNSHSDKQSDSPRSFTYPEALHWTTFACFCYHDTLTAASVSHASFFVTCLAWLPSVGKSRQWPWSKHRRTKNDFTCLTCTQKYLYTVVAQKNKGLIHKNLDAWIKVHFNQKHGDKFQSKNGCQHCNCTQQLLQTTHLHTLGVWLEVWIRTQRWYRESSQPSGRKHLAVPSSTSLNGCDDLHLRQQSKGDSASSSIYYWGHG